MFKEKLDIFINEAKQRGYQVENHPVEEGTFVVSKDNYYHVMIDYRLIFEAHVDYIINDVEQEFERLHNENVTK